MVGPIAHIGTPGTSRYTVDWSPIAKGYSDFGRGIGDLVKGINDLAGKKADKENLSALAALVGDSKQLMGEAARRGVPLSKVREMVSIHSMLAGKQPEPFTLAAGGARYGPGGAEIARNPAAVKDDRTIEQRNLSGFLQRNPGATEADYFKMKRSPGMTVDARQMGSIPVDHKVVYDEQGRPSRYEVIPGSPTARKMAAAAEKATGRAGDKSAQASLVDTHIGRIRKKVGEGAGPFGLIPVTGMAGAAMEDVPGTKAHDVSKLVDSLKANIGFDALNRMRANSPTGGALGQVSERELGFLQSTIASLEQSQGEEQFLENLGLVQNAFNRVIHGTKPGGAPPARFTGGSPGLPSPTQAGVSGLRVPGIPQGNQNPAAVFDQMSEAQLDGLNLANMNEDALDALEAAYKRKKGGTIAGDYMASGIR